MATIRAEKAREANLRKIAANMAREVKAFWANAQKLFEWRVKQKLERKHKEALDQHLQFIVDKTEKYSTLLAESLAESASGQVKYFLTLRPSEFKNTSIAGVYILPPFFYIFLRRVIVPFPKIFINLPRTNEKLHCKGEPYRFSSYQDSSVHTDTQRKIDILLLLKMIILFVLTRYPELVVYVVVVKRMMTESMLRIRVAVMTRKLSKKKNLKQR